MNSTLRTSVAALALLAPLGAALAQGPVFTVQFGQPAIVAQAPRIERFVLATEGRIQPGDELRFQVSGTPGSRVTLDVPGELRNVAMTEVQPGRYTARYVVRRDDNFSAFQRAVATLDKGGRRITAQVDVVRDVEARRDNVAPQISDLTPSDGDRIRERGLSQPAAGVDLDHRLRGVTEDGFGVRRDPAISVPV